jgi:undecaprenyl-diphosphatase
MSAARSGLSPEPPGPADSKVNDAKPVLVADLLRWIGGHVKGFHSAVGLFLTVGLAMAGAALLLFVTVAALVAGGATQRIDHAVLLWFNARATPRLDTAALEITALGSVYVSAVVLLVATLFLWETRHRYSAALLWVAVMGGWLLNTMLHAVFDRPRPDLFEWRVPNGGASGYPSGHAMGAMVLYATLAYLVIRLEGTRKLQRVTVAVFGAAIVLVGLSRLYLGVHYPSDVIGGFLVGFAWATFCALGIEAIRYFRLRRPGLSEEEHDLDRAALPMAATAAAPEPPSAEPGPGTL